MNYAYPYHGVVTNEGFVALGALVPQVINAINNNTVIPYGDFGGPNVYWFQTFDNGLGSLVYTVFDKNTTLGLASYVVKYGAASTIQQVIFQQTIKSEIDLQFLILPAIPTLPNLNGTVTI